jgi:NAD+ synthase (glutamine-hydrolysing)
MKIAIAQLNYHIGNFDYNLEKMLKATADAKAQGADIIIFGELAVTGYPPRDFLEFDDFIVQSENAIEQLAAAAQGIAIAVGAPQRNPILEGKDLFNAAFFLYDGKVQQVAHKALLPTYDVFDEYRYFEPAYEFNVINYQGQRIALTVCEDIWNVGNENPLYRICPLDELQKQGFDFMLNLSASPFSHSHASNRIHTVRANVERYNAPMFYVNHVGSQTEVIFDGGSIVMSPNGDLYEELPYFEECLRVYDLEDVKKGGQNKAQDKDKIALIHDALVLGIKDYFRKSGLRRATLGLSGGIDSAVVAVLAERALGAENVRVLLMPSQYSSDHSINDARQLAEKINIQYDLLYIEEIYKEYEKTLRQLFAGKKEDITEENLQARIRGMLLMAMSNKFGHVLLNTSNKSEAAVGYGTLYGDMAGGISVIGDVYKMDVYALARYINKDEEIIPVNIIEKAPSAELRPDQKDSDSLPEYPLLDAVLYQYIELRQGPKELVAMGFDEALVRRILRMVNINEFKRAQFAPILRVSPKAFGMGRRMPIVGKYLG